MDKGLHIIQPFGAPALCRGLRRQHIGAAQLLLEFLIGKGQGPVAHQVGAGVVHNLAVDFAFGIALACAVEPHQQRPQVVFAGVSGGIQGGLTATGDLQGEVKGGEQRVVTGFILHIDRVRNAGDTLLLGELHLYSGKGVEPVQGVPRGPCCGDVVPAGIALAVLLGAGTPFNVQLDIVALFGLIALGIGHVSVQDIPLGPVIFQGIVLFFRVPREVPEGALDIPVGLCHLGGSGKGVFIHIPGFERDAHINEYAGEVIARVNGGAKHIKGDRCLAVGHNRRE